MLDRSVSYFLSNYWRNVPLYAEKLIPLLDTCLSSNFVLSDKVANAFYELTNKYQNTAELPLENLKEFIREQGYDYILDLVVQDKETVKLLWYMLVLIHELKGSKEGILLVLSLLEDNFDPNKTTIKQWYETIPVGRPNTFTLETAINLSKLGDGFFAKFETFLKNYVYPEMLSMKINYNVDGRITYRPYARVKIDCGASVDTKDGFNCGPASENFVRDLYDGGLASTNFIEIENGYTPHTYLTDVNYYEILIEPKYDEDGKFLGFVKYLGEEGKEVPADVETLYDLYIEYETVAETGVKRISGFHDAEGNDVPFERTIDRETSKVNGYIIGELFYPLQPDGTIAGFDTVGRITGYRTFLEEIDNYIYFSIVGVFVGYEITGTEVDYIFKDPTTGIDYQYMRGGTATT